ncbi:MAG: helix-turn-helix domain-containing protein [Methylovulum sp.]|uniref:AraC-like ligand-binding domain-containing protein n=1 Tax=Methylovulum sp. TaxID=1916980 RepID=UPI002633027E|nr:helix-turn-helix domain-containing protein [Methylovulum sp.]MDD2725226.1 helix-turn-helix domain-containing protein [Methylovulum sp.]MDD5124794.1 helix-turn-helix domain-containing protein [Methylovulum sp.]
MKVDTKILHGSITESIPPARVVKYSTDDFAAHERLEWLREVIGREYANVEITPPRTGVFNEMLIYAWDKLRLSVIRSNEITLQRLPREPDLISQDAYFAAIHLSGNYCLLQNGREVFLKPGDMTLYDATLPHLIRCPQPFSKLLVSIPRPILKERVSGIEHCTALHIPGHLGIGSVAANFIRSCADQAGELNAQEFSTLSEHALDLLTLALATVRPTNFNLSKSRSIALHRVKAFVENHLSDPALNPSKVSAGTGLSPRYINLLFHNEDTSLMRYVWRRRLERCRQDIQSDAHAGRRISDIAFRWGFNDLSHFSRGFRFLFGCSPTECREAQKRE